MRMLEIDRSLSEWCAFFKDMHALGVGKIHSSHEYESFELLCHVLAELRNSAPEMHFNHIVKLGEPSFDDDGFDGVQMASKISTYQTALGVDHIHDLQWMWRHDLKDDPKRILALQNASGLLSEAVDAQKRCGAISRFLCFPYSVAFAEAVHSTDYCDGLVVYRNAQEQEYDGFMERLTQGGKSGIAIRPFAAGAALEDDAASPKVQIDAVLNHPAMEAAILSTSSIDHLKMLLD